MSELLFLEDAYRKTAPATVKGLTDAGGIILDQTIFYAQGGGQPGDSGWLDYEGGRIAIATTMKGEGGDVVLLPAEPVALPKSGAEVEQRLDWARRFNHMRMHTALHLLSVVLPYGVTGGAIGAERGRLDFDIPDSLPERMILQGQLNALVDRNLPVTQHWITEAELDAKPEMVKTLSVKPPRGAGRIRLVQIGEGAAQIDLQPCGGTHVARTGEIGKLEILKIENKGRQNRRISIGFA